MIEGLPLLLGVRRSAEDIFAGRIRVELGGVTYVLPVLSRRANREWLESLDARDVETLRALEKVDDPRAIAGILAGSDEQLIDALLAYDKTGVLPSRDALDDATDLELFRAIAEVWLAANPKVAIGLGLWPTQSLPPSPSPPVPTDGGPVSSRTS